ncbi:MAG: adenosylcobinamide-GDP ribazoletransferase [Desulfobacteraceae bacterium]|nr:MAG: adenosylcobinamide-GDP ribazoletransferase [Desulfobacteraceae bacterium]
MDPRGLITAMRTLTAVPLGGRDAARFSDSLFWFPLVGFFLGVVLLFIGKAWNGVVGDDWPGGGAVIFLTAQILLTRGLHMDGLADWADGLGGSRDRETRLAIMKDHHLGSFGVIAMVVDILAKWVVLERLLASAGLGVIVPVSVVSRAAMVSLMTNLPYARSGQGMARPFMDDLSHGKEAAAALFAVCLCLLFGPLGIGLFAAGWCITRILGPAFRKGFGGITGDLLGATNEMMEILLLWLCASLGNLVLPYLGWVWLWP